MRAHSGMAAALLLAFVAVLSTPAAAAEWETVSIEGQETVFLDRGSVHLDGGLAQVRVLKNYTAVAFLGDDGFPHRSKLVLYAINCADRSLGLARWALHSGELGSGATVLANRANTVAFYVPHRGETDGALVSAVCHS